MDNSLSNYIKLLKELGFEYVVVDGETDPKTVEEKIKKLQQLNQQIQNCKKCDLYKERIQAVLGEGNINARLMFIGEAPGGDEDKQGRPFVGRAGKLLTKLIEEAGHKREEFYITNICKCRPPGNRTPTPWEMEACFPYLEEQIQIIDPKVLCLLGSTAARAFLGRNVSITKERGSVINWKGRLVYLTYHPAFVLRNPSHEKTLLEDIKRAIQLAYKED
ncbi:MAG: uracil-DNA glycosylase [Aquificae bacterium]|nr:uracil-DNA glycosylase [Aquificota bacterium]